MTKNAFTRTLGIPVPQTEKENPAQTLNSAGGYTFTVDAKSRLERFLILGTDGGTYYVGERDLTKQNIDFLIKMIKEDGAMVVGTICEVSADGRAYRNSAAIFALALVFTHGDADTKVFARTNFNQIVRTSTHLFEFAQYVELLGGWGRSKRSAVADWYTNKSPENLAYQAVKYRQRAGWTHRDLFRLAHPTNVDSRVGSFILGKETPYQSGIIEGFQALQAEDSVTGVINILDTFPNLPWEAIPTQFLKDAEVWKKLFYNGQLNGQALVRNITRLARISAFDDMVFARDYATRLADEGMIAKTRLHPINYLNAYTVHTEGQVNRNHSGVWYSERNKNWNTVPIIVDALNEGFHLSFKHVEPAGKRTMLALDISGSMSQNANGMDLSCAQVCGAMAMTVARTEPYYMIRGFSDGRPGGVGDRRFGQHSKLSDLGITPNMGLGQVMDKISNQNFGGTDCALPMIWALENKIEIDTFQVYTDNETWAGSKHPHIALREYRQKMGIDAKLAVVGIAATDFTIADPQDRGMMDFVGTDSNMPKVMADFSRGSI